MGELIYQPRGRALEYSPLACDLFRNCTHGCQYCYYPRTKDVGIHAFEVHPSLKKSLLERFSKEAERFRNDPMDILFSFSSDVYQSNETAEFMGGIWDICEEMNLRVQVLTKGGFRAVRHFEQFAKNGWKFGSTICMMDEGLRAKWEVSAPSIASRIEALRIAHRNGIYTWVSVEPVIDPEQALLVMKEAKPYVRLWKVGKLNHMSEIEKTIDWAKFLRDAEDALMGSEVYIKKDLEEYRSAWRGV